MSKVRFHLIVLQVNIFLISLFVLLLIGLFSSSSKFIIYYSVVLLLTLSLTWIWIALTSIVLPKILYDTNTDYINKCAAKNIAVRKQNNIHKFFYLFYKIGQIFNLLFIIASAYIILTPKLSVDFFLFIVILVFLIVSLSLGFVLNLVYFFICNSENIKYQVDYNYSSRVLKSIIVIPLVLFSILFSFLGWYRYNTVCTKPAFLACNKAEFNPKLKEVEVERQRNNNKYWFL